MQRACVLVAVLLAANAALPDHPTAQRPGWIMPYSDPLGTSCEIDGNPQGTVTVHLIHRFNRNVAGSRFRIDKGLTGFTWVADVPQGPTTVVGTAETGALYAYNFCAFGDHHFLDVMYTAAGAADVCSKLRVVASPTAVTGNIEALYCDLSAVTAEGWLVVVNSDDECSCTYSPAVEETSWGQIKSLYLQ